MSWLKKSKLKNKQGKKININKYTAQAKDGGKYRNN